MENIESKKVQLGSTHYYCILQGLWEQAGGWVGDYSLASIFNSMHAHWKICESRKFLNVRRWMKKGCDWN
jgi:hypothetical protein